VTASHPTSSPSMDPRLVTWRRRIFLATWLCYAGYYFGRKPYYVAKERLATELSFDATTLGTIGALYLVAYALAQFAAGALGHRFGPRAVVLWGMSVSIACNIGFGVSSSEAAFFVLMTINGAAQATGWSANVGTMAAWFHHGERGRVMGLWSTNFQAGGVLANMMAAFVLGRFAGPGDWRVAIFAGATVLGAVWLIVFFNQRNSPHDVGLPTIHDPTTTTSSTSSPTTTEGPADASLGWTRDVVINLAIVSTYYFFVKLIRYALWSWAPYFLARNFGQRGDDAGYLSTIFDVCGVLGVVVTGWLSDRFFGSRRAGVSFLMTLLLVASCVFLVVAGSVSVAAFAVGIAVAGFSLYGPDALLTGAGAMDIGSRRGATLAAGIISGFGSLGPIVQELVIGRLYDDGGGSLGPIFALLMVSSVIAATVLGVAVLRNRAGRTAL
jgi:sugar phosphate permease